MIRRLVTLTGAILVVLGMLAVPAQADHVAEVRGDRCIVGYWTSPIPGVRLEGTLTSRVVKDGVPQRFVCHFDDLPRFVEGGERGDNLWEDWYAPTKAVNEWVECWGHSDAVDHHVAHGPGTFTMTPSGKGVLRCDLGGFKE